MIKIIRGSKTTDIAEASLIERFGLSEIQAKSILAMQLRRLTGLERDAIENELAELIKLIGELEAILSDELKILAIIKEELQEMKDKYGDDRRSKIINSELGKFSDEELIPEEESIILLTEENYIKRTLVSDYRKQHRGGKGRRGMTTKDTDVIDHMIQASTHDWLLFFTNKGRVFRLKAYEVPAAGLAAKGVAVINLLQLQPEEKVTSLIRMPKGGEDSEGFLFMTTVKGVIKKTPLEDYANIRNSGLIAINVDEDDELRWIKRSSGENDIIISTSAGQAVRFSEKDVRSMGRVARGVRGVRLRPNDQVVGMDIADDSKKILVVSENGYGKLTKTSNFPTHKRGGVGIKAAVVTAKTGPIMSARSVGSDDKEMLLISSLGQTIRTDISSVPTLGRTTQGVRIMKLADGDAVASLGLVKEQEEVEESED